MNRALAAGVMSALLAGCTAGPPRPVEIDTRNDACSWCRMGISDLRVAAQLVAPSEEPRLFDDIACLRDYLAGGATIPPGAIAYVADHRTKAWVVAARAVYSRIDTLSTPMASRLAAWADESSRSADDASRSADQASGSADEVAMSGNPATVKDIFGALGPPEGVR